ncbi:hypothetical protein [Sinobaca sp. H24]|uniref:hypothetical protein n=1 Tax=Sinobaca sp. H24 TaxID=2923376 RepID=UPI00207A1C01|nr:hypothetical protein [Sinobaca sp. H24]
MNQESKKQSKLNQMDEVINHSESGYLKTVHETVKQIFDLDLKEISDRGEGLQQERYSDPVMEAAAENRQPITDAEIMNLPKWEVLQDCLEQEAHRDGERARMWIDSVFGINLKGVASLEEARISVYSKGIWVSRQPEDLIVIDTGKGDIDVHVYPSAAYIKSEGTPELPVSLQQALLSLGYIRLEENNAFYYKNEKNESVPPSFKGRTMAVISEATALLT